MRLWPGRYARRWAALVSWTRWQTVELRIGRITTLAQAKHKVRTRLLCGRCWARWPGTAAGRAHLMEQQGRPLRRGHCSQLPLQALHLLRIQALKLARSRAVLQAGGG